MRENADDESRAALGDLTGGGTRFAEQSLVEALDEIASGRISSAGGSSAALTAALAAAVIAAVAESQASAWDGSSAALAQASALRSRLYKLAIADADAFACARRLLHRPTSDDGDPATAQRRDYELAVALQAAAEVPVAIAEAAADVAALALWTERAAPAGDRIDAVAAACLAEAAAAAAAALVRVNLGVRPEDEFAARAESAARAARDSRAEAEASS